MSKPVLKEAAPMPGDSPVSALEDKIPAKKEILSTESEIKTTEAVIEEIALLGITEALPDKSKDEKTWQTIQTILHPKPTSVEIEEDFLCPITQSLIRDPVTTADGQMYEKEAIEEWLATQNTSPATNKLLDSKQLTPSVFAKKQIHGLVDRNPELKDSDEWHLPQSWIAELQKACQTGDEKIIKELVSRDRRLLVHTFKEKYIGQTALHFAAAGHAKSLDIIIELLESRQKGLALAALLQPDREGRLPIHQALLAQQDAQTLLKLSAWMGEQLETVQPLSDGWPSGFDFRALNEALAWSVAQEDLGKIRCWLRLGAQPHAKTKAGETRVYQAVKQNRPRSLALLLEAKANPNLADERLDDTPLHAAVYQGHREMVITLVRAGASLDRSLKNGKTPLHLAAERNAADMLEALFGKDKVLPEFLREAQDSEGHTALHRAVISGSMATLKWLLTRQANVQAVNLKGQTGLHLAASFNRTDLMTVLLENGASLSALDADGNTALHSAARAGAAQAVSALLRAGISPNLKNKAGQTARQLTEIDKHEETLKQHDQTIAELQAAEEKMLKGQGILGIFLIKQQQIIRDLQAQNEELQEQNKTLRQELTQLIRQEIKPLAEWREKQQSLLQNELIIACEQGDLKAVQTALGKGARAIPLDVKQDKHPLGAAVWGMNPEVVNELLKQIGGIEPMTWEECEKINLERYKEVFIVSKFTPETYGEWYGLLKKIERSPFVRAYHLEEGNKKWKNYDWREWNNLMKAAEGWNGSMSKIAGMVEASAVLAATEKEYENYRTQIQKEIRKLAIIPSSPIKMGIFESKHKAEEKQNPLLLPLQDELVTACEQGDAKATLALLKKGAKPDAANSAGKQPLGAAVWGMNPEVVNELLKHTGGVASMTWAECEAHNKKHYNNEIFIVDQFAPTTFGEWNKLLLKIDPNPFIRAYHLQKADEQCHDRYSSWQNVSHMVRSRSKGEHVWLDLRVVLGSTEKGYVGYRTQIKQGIESALRPTVGKTF